MDKDNRPGGIERRIVFVRRSRGNRDCLSDAFIWKGSNIRRYDIPMKRTATAISLLLCLAAPLAAADSDAAPKWVMEGSRFDKGSIISIGVGDSRLESLARALADMAKMKKTLAKHQPGVDESGASIEEQRVSTRLVDTVEDKFGPIVVRERMESRMSTTIDGSQTSESKAASGSDKRKTAQQAYEELAKEFDAKPSESQFVSSDVHLAMTSGHKSLVVDMKLESLTSGDMSQSHESSDVAIRSQDISVADLIQEINKQGIEIRRYQDPDGHTEYAGLTMKAPAGMKTEGLDESK